MVIQLNTLNQYNSPDELLRLILNINIEALSELLEDEELKEWDFLLENFQSSRNELKEMIKEQYFIYYRMSKEEHPTWYVVLLKPKWRRILMETLYILEEDFYAQGKSEAVVQLWGRFFDLEIEKTFAPKLQLKGLIQNRYTKTVKI